MKRAERHSGPIVSCVTPLSLNHVKSKKQETNIKKYCAFPVCRAGRPRCDPKRPHVLYTIS